MMMFIGIAKDSNFLSFGGVCNECMYKQSCMCVCVHILITVTSSYVPLLLSTLISDTSFSLNLEFAGSVSLLLDPTVTWSYRDTPPWKAVMWVIKTQIQVFMPAQQVYILLSHPHSLLHFLWWDGSSPSCLSWPWMHWSWGKPWPCVPLFHRVGRDSRPGQRSFSFLPFQLPLSLCAHRFSVLSVSFLRSGNVFCAEHHVEETTDKRGRQESMKTTGMLGAEIRKS